MTSSPAFSPVRDLPTAVLSQELRLPASVCATSPTRCSRLTARASRVKTVIISGSGNVAIYATKKATELGGKVVTVSDSNGYIYDPDGIDLDVVKQIKEVERGRIKEYVNRTSHKNAEYHEGSVWGAKIKADIALPCATQNEINGDFAKNLAANGVYAVAEGANMPSTPDAIEVYFDKQDALRSRKGCKRRRRCYFWS